MGAKGPLTLGGTPVRLHIYTEDVDSLFGHEWSIATHTRDLTVDEMKKAAEELFSRA